MQCNIHLGKYSLVFAKNRQVLAFINKAEYVSVIFEWRMTLFLKLVSMAVIALRFAYHRFVEYAFIFREYLIVKSMILFTWNWNLLLCLSIISKSICLLQSISLLNHKML